MLLPQTQVVLLEETQSLVILLLQLRLLVVVQAVKLILPVATVDPVVVAVQAQQQAQGEPETHLTHLLLKETMGEQVPMLGVEAVAVVLAVQVLLVLLKALGMEQMAATGQRLLFLEYRPHMLVAVEAVVYLVVGMVAPAAEVTEGLLYLLLLLALAELAIRAGEVEVEGQVVPY